MIDPETPGSEKLDDTLIWHHPRSKSSSGEERSLTDTSGSDIRTKLPGRKPPSAGEFWFNNGFHKPMLIHELIPNNELLIVNPRRRGGLILYKRYYTEFAGPGAAVGGKFDLDCQEVLPVGNLELIGPQSPPERERAYLIRRQWIRLTKEITGHPDPLQRAQKILEQFEGFFNRETVAQIPDEALALLVGIFPQTIGMWRSKFRKSA